MDFVTPASEVYPYNIHSEVIPRRFYGSCTGLSLGRSQIQIFGTRSRDWKTDRQKHHQIQAQEKIQIPDSMGSSLRTSFFSDRRISHTHHPTMTSRPQAGRSSAWQDQIESILQRIQRQSGRNQPARPPEEASAAVGRGLASRLLEGIENEDTAAQAVGDQIIATLFEPNISPSLSSSFFSNLKPSHAVLLEWMPRWMVQAEEICMEHNDGGDSLSFLIRAYAQCCCEQENVDSVANAFDRFKLSSSRTCALREFSREAFSSSDVPTILMLSPLMATCVMQLSRPLYEKMSFLQAIWRETWMQIRQGNGVELLSWMSLSLHLFLSGVQCESRETQSASMELAYLWLVELVDMAAALPVTMEESDSESFGSFLSMIVDKILAHFFVPTCRIAMEPVLVQLVTIIKKDRRMMHVNCATCFRLGSLALSTPIKHDICGLLTLLVEFPRPNGDLVQGLLHTLSCIFAQDDTCKDLARRMYTLVASSGSDQVKEDSELTSMVQLFQANCHEDKLLSVMTASLEHIDPLQVSAVHQNAAVLLGYSLLFHIRVDHELVYSYLKALLQQFPHLGITLLPVLLQSIQTASNEKDGATLLHQLRFLCDAVAKDPHCAQEVWNLVGVTMVQRDSPTPVRAAAIRMYPRLCASNKRLYRRIIDTLGSFVDSKEPEIRLSVAATLDDLARDDRIRDVSDVIGWVQTYLSDEMAYVMYYAVSCLHRLTVAQELDFDLVIKVLNKRLCPVGDVQEVLKLPGNVIEALVLLLGDGECDSGTDDDEEKIASTTQDLLGVSPQVSGAVRTLIDLSLLPIESTTQVAFTRDMVSHIRLNIYRSLSSYSLFALGLDEAGVKSAIMNQEGAASSTTDASLRYMALKQIAAEGLEYPPAVTTDTIKSDPTVSLVRKMLAYEEESLGSSIWQKGGKTSSASSKADRTTAPKAAFSALPSPVVIEKLYTPNPCSSTSIASLLCYEGNSVSDLFDYASDISASGNDFMFHVFNLQGWLHAMSMVWAGIVASDDQSKVEALSSAIEEVNGWRELLDCSDIPCMALASLALFVPDTLAGITSVSDIDLSPIIEGIQADIELSYEGHQFENRDVANICMALLGVRAVHSRSNAFLGKAIDILEQSVQDHRGLASFGAFYGLGMIAQTVGVVFESDDIDAESSGGTSQQLLWVNRIAAILVDELHLCFQNSAPQCITLAACIRSGKASPDLLSSISDMSEDLSIPDANTQKAKSLLLGLGLCVRAIGVVSTDLLVCVHEFASKLPWGSGKGFVLPNAALSCMSAGRLRQSDVDVFVRENQNLVEAFLGGSDDSTSEDALYACIGMQANLPYAESTDNGLSIVSRIVENNDLSNSDEWYSALLIPVTLFVSTFPCMGSGSSLFCSAPSLHPHTTKEMTSKVANLFSGVIKTAGHNKSTTMATQLLGILASMKGGPSNAPPTSIFGSVGASSETEVINQSMVSLERLPSPQEKTLLKSTMDLIQQEWKRVVSKTQKSGTNLARLLACLEPISLPSQFSRSLIEPMLAIDMDDLKSACAALLVAQASGRRRAAFDGRDYVKLVTRLALLPPPSFRSLFGGGSGAVTFVSSLHKILPKIPSDSVENVLLHLWKICAIELEAKETVSCTTGYLHSLSLLLISRNETYSSRLSPRTQSSIVQVLLRPVFLTLCQNKVISGGIETSAEVQLVVEAYLDCLMLIEYSILEEKQFLLMNDNESEDTSVSRADCTVCLVSRDYFKQKDRASKELLRVIAWFAGQDETAANGGALRELAVRIAIAAKAEDSLSKKEIVSLLFEALHVHGPGTLCLELLGMLTSLWSDDTECDAETSSAGVFFDGMNQISVLAPGTLADVSKLLIHDLPMNMGVFARTERLQGFISNRVWRLRKAWSDQRAGQTDVSTLENILYHCRAQDTNDFLPASVTISRLTESTLVNTE